MGFLARNGLFNLVVLMVCCGAASAQVSITEIMYHPASENPAEEFVELQNLAGTNVSLAGWRFTKGVAFTFSNNVTLPAGGFVVVVANSNSFSAKYPGVTNFVGNWVGTLNNSDETIQLEDDAGNTVDEVFYADEGDYAIRVRGALDNGHRGWDWQALPDGGGKSLERINAALTGKCGQNWAASTPTNGTPGAANSVAAANIAPLIRNVAHYPLVPRSTNTVTIVAQLTDEQTSGLSATLYWRQANVAAPGAFSAAPMFDDGAHGDGNAGDRLFGVVLSANPNGAVIEFYVSASDAQANSRTWPAPARESNGTPIQVCNALYQVDDAPTDSTRPSYRIVMTKPEYDELYAIPNEGLPNELSDAQFNGTWITADGIGTESRYLCSFRNRGATRNVQPPNYRVSIPSDRRWRGVTALNLNSQYTHCQLIGGRLAALAGLVTEAHHRVQLRVNGNERAQAGLPQFGAYIHQEAVDADLAANHFPTDDKGNLYRGHHYPWTADLSYQGANWQTYTNLGYSKNSNRSENDWSDLINLTAVLNNTPDNNYWSAVQQVVDVNQWLRYFAVFTLIGSRETALGTGAGDDFSMYRGMSDPRFRLLGHDWDTVLDQGDTAGDPNQTLFGAANGLDISGGTPGVAAVSRFLKHPEIAPLYFGELLYQLSNTFAPAEMSRTLDDTLGSWVPAGYVTTMKTYATNRYAGALAQIPQALTIDGSSPAGTVTGGISRYTTANVTFFGKGHAARTRSVKLNGQIIPWTAWTARWTNTVTLRPGINNLLVQSFDVNGNEVASVSRRVWYDNSTSVTVGGTISGNTTWTNGGPAFNLTASVTVANGATLTIQPGTTVFMGSGVNLTVANGGRILAEGVATNRIHFMPTPGSGASWGGVTINGGAGSPETRIAHAHFEGNNSTCIQVTAGTVYFDNLTFGTTTRQYLSLDGASFLVQNCNFPTPTAAFELVHGTLGIKSGGRGVFARNFFGAANGYNDVVDFTGGKRPAPIVHFLDNVFIGSGDDHLDLDDTDAWVEGNIFLHAHKNGSPDSASAISGGSDIAQPSAVTIRGNIFFDCDQVAMAKQGDFFTLQNNTMVRQSRQGGTETSAGVVRLSDEGVAEGAGMYLAGNIIVDGEALVLERTNAVVTITNNLIYQVAGAVWTGPGGNNQTNNPLFVHVPTVAETTNFTSWAAAQVMREWLALRDGSPARNAGPDQKDLGGVIARGVSISGEPQAPTAATNATLTFGPLATGSGIPVSGFPLGSGFTHYRWRLNGGGWSVETPIATPVSLTNLTNGTYAVAAAGKLDSGLYQDAVEVGVGALTTTSRTWTVNTALPRGLQLNEILARNVNTLRTNGESPDLIELYNSSASTIDLSGKGLTDNPAQKYKYTFAPGMMLGAGQYLVLYSDSSGAAVQNLGFALKSDGAAVYLYDSSGNGGALLDSVSFGPQLIDLSIGRQADGNWGLSQPTFGTTNVAKPAANGRMLRINEWLASGSPLAPDDFIELYNPDPVPAAMGGLYLTDAPDGSPAQHQIAPLSYLGAGGYFAFKADGNVNSGPEHLNFKLAPEVGSIGLFAADLSLIDRVVYGPQTTGVSQGRAPDGSDQLDFFTTPTPGAGNPGVLPVYVTNLTLNLLAYTNVWRFNQSNNLDGVNWTATNYNDSAWQSGPGLLAAEDLASIVPLINTTLLAPNAPPPGLNSGHAYYFRAPLVLSNALTDYTITARMRLDDCGVLYINGIEFSRIRMSAGTITNLSFGGGAVGANVEADVDEVFTIPPSAFRSGTNIIAMEVHQANAGSSDIVWGLAIEASRVVTNVTSVVLNEVLADNASFSNSDGTITDWIELYNPSATAVNLAGYSLSDDPGLPGRWVFPAGVTLASGNYLLVRCDSSSPASTTNGPVLNTGFGLDSAGDAICLFTPGNTLFDAVTFGPQAADFSLGHTPDGASSWGLTLPTPAAANINAALGNVNNVRLNEWAASVTGGPDWFELYNPNPQPVALGGLYLTDALANRTKHLIAALSFLGVNTNGWRKFVADGDTAQGANHVNFSLSASGEALGLFPPGTAPAIDSVTFGAQANDVSEGRFPDGATDRVFFTKPSPGAANWLYLTNIVINEVLTHTDLPLEDAVELRNLSGAPVDVSGWFLSDSASDLKKFRIPNGTIIPAGGYKVFYEADFNPQPGLAGNFSFSAANGDDVWLTAADLVGVASGYRDYAKFGPQFNGVSFGRYVTSVGTDFPALSALTFGTAVTAQSPTNQVSVFRTGGGAANAYPRVGPVVITEIMYHPPPVAGNENPDEEFIELHNLTGVPLPLYDTFHPTNGWKLRDAVSFQFTTNHSIPAGGYLLVVGFDPATNAAAALVAFRTKYGTNGTVVGPWSGRLDNAGESIELIAPDAPQTTGPDLGFVPYVLMDKVVYSDTAPWPASADGVGASLQRVSFTAYGNDPSNWLAAAPNAGTSGLADSDGDGMPDFWEDANGLNKFVNDAALDADLDGFSNLQEYIAGTNPQNAASSLRFDSVTWNGGNVQMQFTAAADRTYSILYSDPLEAGAWLKLTDVPAEASPRSVVVSDGGLPNQAQRFYRIVTPAAP